MVKTIYVGNLPFSATEADVRELFEQYGPVQSVKLINDRDTGKPRGFGFVQMEGAAAQDAIEALDGFEYNRRILHVNEAREREGQGNRPGGGRADFKRDFIDPSVPGGERGGGRNRFAGGRRERGDRRERNRRDDRDDWDEQDKRERSRRDR